MESLEATAAGKVRAWAVAVLAAAALAWPAGADAGSLLVVDEVVLSEGYYVFDSVNITSTGSLKLTGEVTIVCTGSGPGTFTLAGEIKGEQVSAQFETTNGVDGLAGRDGSELPGYAGEPGGDGGDVRAADGASAWSLTVLAESDIVLEGLVDLRGSGGNHQGGRAGHGGAGGDGEVSPYAGPAGTLGGRGGSNYGGAGGLGGLVVFESGSGQIRFGSPAVHGVIDVRGGDGGSGGTGGDGGDGGKGGGSGFYPEGGRGGNGGDGGDSVGGNGGGGGSVILRGPVILDADLEARLDGGQGGGTSMYGWYGWYGYGGLGTLRYAPTGSVGDTGAARPGQDGPDGAVTATLTASGRLDVTAPGDTAIGTSENYPGGDRPGGPEVPAMAIDDDPTTKYLNFDKAGSGLTITPALGPVWLQGIALTTANDEPSRDPASVTITGSHEGSVWEPIITDLATPLPDERHSETVFYFQPETEGTFAMYRVIFPSLKDAASANSVQIAEIRLIGDVPEPASLALLAAGSLALLRRRRQA